MTDPQQPQLPEGLALACVAAVDRGAFRILDGTREVPAELAGKFYFLADTPEELPCVGDRVAVQYHDGGAAAIIHSLLPRQSVLRRRRAGDKVEYQMIAANIDMAFIVQSCHFDFNIRRMDRYLVMAADGGVEPILLLTKIDLVTPEALAEMIAAIRAAGITARIIPLSNHTGAGLEEFRSLLTPGRSCCLLGSSGVGKTTLINRLLEREAFNTKEVSATGEGTHATSRRQLTLLENGAMVIDTPGMRELGLLASGEGLELGFDDIQSLGAGCRYSDCTHLREPGCAVRAAVAAGSLSQERYDSYLKLKKESDFYGMSYAEKRKKDKEFGRFINKALKQIKK
ncbi:MAG TPA: ribosome small subunit-dependent GTPase A [bacterium]|nr:ribosome small subunit-dependent GTPase A [bacterium]HPR87560.1 ribosome small subunit-dependent GTPase A [bacterium]